MALILWFLGLLALFVSSVFPVEKGDTKAYAGIAAQLFLPFGISDPLSSKGRFLAYLSSSLPRIWNLVGLVDVLSEGGE